MSEDPPPDEELTERQKEMVEQIGEAIDVATATIVTQLGTLAGKVDDNGAQLARLTQGVSDLASMLTDKLAALDGKVTAVQEQNATDHAEIIAKLDEVLARLPKDEPPPPPQWTLKTEIDCAVVDARLYLYDGFNPANGQGPRDTSQIEVRDEGEGSFLRFKSEPVDHDVEVWCGPLQKTITFPAGSYVSSGASIVEKHGSILYGAVEVDCRAVQASKGTRIAVLLWPSAGKWPAAGEIDYPEVSGDGKDQERQRCGLNSHYSDGGTHKQHQVQDIPVNMLDWHTFRVEWTPDAIVAYIDGVEVGRVTDDIPSGPMHPCIQTALQSADKDGHARAGTTPGGVDVKGWRVFTYTP